MTTVEADRTSTLREPAPLAVPALLAKAFLYVTGKGGAGKTTVAAALGLAAASRGHRTVVCDLAGSNQLARAYGYADARRGEAELGERLWSLSVDPQEAFEEWLQRQAGDTAAVAVLKRSRAFAHLVAAAPGAKELVTIGKVVDLARLERQPGFDLVIADGPSTGHALGMLTAPQTLGEVAGIGPVGADAGELRAFLADPRRRLRRRIAAEGDVRPRGARARARPAGRRRSRARPDLHQRAVSGPFTDEEAERLRTVADRAPAVRAALAQHRHARAQAAYVRHLREQARAPVVTLPYLFVARLGPPEYAVLARELSRGRA